MKQYIKYFVLGALVCLPWSGHIDGRGFGGGGFRGGFGGGGFGGYRGGFSGGYSGDFSSSRGSFDSSRSFSGYSGWNRGGASGSYDRSWDGSRGGSINTEGSRDAGYGRFGGYAGSSRETTITGPEGRSYSGSSERGAAMGPYGRVVGGGEHTGTATGYRGTATNSWQSAFAGRSFPTDMGLGHYSAFGIGGVTHSTSYWSRGYCANRGAYVRSGFGYYGCFHPGWWAAHPGCWYAAGWAANDAWRVATWASLAAFCGYAGTGTDYDYGGNVVYQDNAVYDNGQQVATAPEYAQQATAIADQGQKADPPPTADWKALGVFALVQGDEKTSNNIFQLAIDKNGIIRGNYYDGLMDTTTPVFGSVDKKSQRAAWTIGKKKDRVFETGIANLTKDETAVLVHIGTDKTQQWLLVRVQQPSGMAGQ